MKPPALVAFSMILFVCPVLAQSQQSPTSPSNTVPYPPECVGLFPPEASTDKAAAAVTALKTASDYQSVAKAFEEVTTYLPSNERIAQCEAAATRLERKDYPEAVVHMLALLDALRATNFQTAFWIEVGMAQQRASAAEYEGLLEKHNKLVQDYNYLLGYTRGLSAVPRGYAPAPTYTAPPALPLWKRMLIGAAQGYANSQSRQINCQGNTTYYLGSSSTEMRCQ